MKFVIILLLLISLNAFGQTDTIQTDVPAIKDVYANDFTFGCLLSYPHIGFPDDPYVPGQSSVVAPNGGYLIQFHMNSMSPGNNMKPQNTVDISASAAAYNAAGTQEERDSIDVHPVVRFNGNMIAQLNWAQRQGFVFRGHTLVWHNQTPGTAFFRTGYSSSGERLSPERMNERMRNYIREVIRLLHEDWPGMVNAMDVVNEAVADNGTFRTSNNEWYDVYGDNSYVMKAFEYTREATEYYGETQMMLYYNDYNTHSSAKADGIVELLTPVWEAGLLDGIGMQHHDQRTSPNAQQFINSYDKFYPICNEMAITELDVNPQSGITDFILQQQANQYAMLFKLFIERSAGSGRGKIVNVSKDGLNDQYAFVANASLWDANNQVKPAFWAVVDVGLHYNALDSLIAHADSLDESDYTAESWAQFTDSLAAAFAVMAQDYSYMVSAADALRDAREALESAYEGLTDITTGVADGGNDMPREYALYQNYPNPFNPTTQIKYSIPEAGDISLKVYDLLGREVATLFEGHRGTGTYRAEFDGTGLPSGVYIYKLHTDTFSEVKKLLFLR
jgi:endo-1,4-beta-xylanase